MVFVDTSAWFAKFLPSDPDHTRIKACLDQTDEALITTDYCIDETLTLFLARKRPSLALQAGRAFFHTDIADIHFVTQGQIHRAWILFQLRADSGWSFTDCTSKIVIDDLGIKTATALDEHFRQFGDVTVVP